MTYALQAVGIFTRNVGTFSSAMAQERIGAYNAEVARENARTAYEGKLLEAQQADWNADISDQNAQLATEAAAFHEAQIRRRTGVVQGQNRASIGASGVTFAGSPIEALADNAYQGETEALVARYQGDLQALAEKRQAQQQRYLGQVKRWQGEESLLVGDQQARLYEYQAKMAKIASYLKVVGDTASGVGSMVGGMGGAGAAGAGGTGG